MKGLSIFSRKVGVPILVGADSIGRDILAKEKILFASSWQNSGWNNYSGSWMNSGWNNYSGSWMNSGWNNYSGNWTNSGWNNYGGGK